MMDFIELSGNGYGIVKSIHLVFMVSFFAGFFYLLRLFVYVADANEKPQQEKEILQKQYLFMIRRLWNIIVLPASFIVLITGLILLADHNFMRMKLPFMHLKLSLLIGLAIFQFWSWKYILRLKNNKKSITSVGLRQINEIATLFLFAIIFVVVLKNSIFDIGWQILISFVLLIIVIMGIVKWVNTKK